MDLSGSSRPVIGLTTYLEQVRTGIWDVPAAYLPSDYFEGVIMAGGIAVLLPPQPVDPGSAAGVLDGLDALVITGGYDLDPAAYGQQPHPSTDAPRSARDAWEFALLRGRAGAGAAGAGDLSRRADAQRRVRRNAAPAPARRDRPRRASGGQRGVRHVAGAHVPGTRLAGLLGETADASCYHHQAIDKVGESLVVSAWDADGVVEALELPGQDAGAFVLAVQWHPEKSLDDLRLFAAVVDAARSYAGGPQ